MALWVITFAEKIDWWENQITAGGMWETPFLFLFCNGLFVLSLTFHTGFLQRKLSGKGHKRQLCTHVLSIICQLTLKVFSLSPVVGSAKLIRCALLSSAVHSLWMWPIMSKQKPLPLFCLFHEIWMRIMFVTFIQNLNSARFTQLFHQHCSNILATSYWTSRL